MIFIAFIVLNCKSGCCEYILYAILNCGGK